MSRRVVLILVALALASCRAEPMPTPDAETTQVDVEEAARAAQPTEAPTIPCMPTPADIATPISAPTDRNTPVPAVTMMPTKTPAPTQPPAPTATAVPKPRLAGADRVVAFNPGPGAKAHYGDPAALLGTPDAVEEPCCRGIVQLGRGGSVLLAFVEHTIVDGKGADFQVYGESAKDDFLMIEVSGRGQTWATFPKVSESPGGLDLADVGMQEATYVRLTDLQPGTSTGAEVDAVMALHARPGVGENLPELPDAVARRDLALYEGENSRMKVLGTVQAGDGLTVVGSGRASGWAKVQAVGGSSGWCSVADLGLNVALRGYPRTQGPATPTPAAAGAPVRTETGGWIVFRRDGANYRVHTATDEIVASSDSECELAGEYRDRYRPSEAENLSPDGIWIAESSTKGRNDEAKELYIRRAVGTGEYRVGTGDLVHVGRPYWSPDSQWVAFTTGQGSSLKVVNLQSREVTTLYECGIPWAPGVPGAPGDATRPSGPGCILDILWLPQSQQVSFTAWIDSNQSGRLEFVDNTDVLVVGADGRGLRNLTSSAVEYEFLCGWLEAKH